MTTETAQIRGAGTPESVWLPWLARLNLPALRVDPAPAHVVCVAPHPDDEVLAVGGLLALLAAAGSLVEVIAVTDGDASNPGGSIAPAALARLRVQETERALNALGITTPVQRLGLADGGADALRAPVLAALRDTLPGTWLLAPWDRDGHPDHEAVGRAAARAAAETGARLLAYPVWAWHWAKPADLPCSRARLVALSEPVRRLKQRAIAEFETQIRPIGPRPQDAPVLPPHVLARFGRAYEVVFG